MKGSQENLVISSRTMTTLVSNFISAKETHKFVDIEPSPHYGEDEKNGPCNERLTGKLGDIDQDGDDHVGETLSAH